LIAAFCFIGAEALAQPSEDALKQRFAQRMSRVQALKDAGKIGETTEGTLGVVSGDAAAQQIVQEENADRAALYVHIAKRTGEDPREVAVQAAIRNYNAAKPDHYLRLRDGRWVQKKSVKAGAAGSS
jgi:uncharacterized protein YdbL (DUF1318 family)